MTIHIDQRVCTLYNVVNLEGLSVIASGEKNLNAFQK